MARSAMPPEAAPLPAPGMTQAQHPGMLREAASGGPFSPPRATPNA